MNSTINYPCQTRTNQVSTKHLKFFFLDDISVDNKPWPSSGHNVHSHVKSEYTLPESSGVSTGGHPGSSETILPDSSQSLPPLMHMGYAVSRHTGSHPSVVAAGQHNILQQAAMCPYTQKTGWQRSLTQLCLKIKANVKKRQNNIQITNAWTDKIKLNLRFNL